MSPTVIVQNISTFLNAAGQATITAAQINNGSFDNCGIVTYSNHSLFANHFQLYKVELTL
jgi:hypothetical protein